MGALVDHVDLTGGEAPPSPSGPISEEAARALQTPPAVPLPRHLQVLRFNQRQIEFVFKSRRHLGEVWSMRAYRDDDTVTSHPDHVKSILTAKPQDAPSLTGESPLRPVVGPNSVLTAVGERHMRQRKLLLPPFHGEAIERYAEMIAGAADHEIDRWPVGESFALAPRMQAITLDVIMAGIFGIEGRPERGTPEHGLRTAVRQLVDLSTTPIAQVGELLNISSDEPRAPLKVALAYLDRPTFAIIAKRRKETDLGERGDILSLLVEATTEDGERLTDQELRDELLTLVLAGHETTANQLAWTWERLVRFPEAHDRLRETVRAGDGTEEIERVIQESMRSRPVIPMIGRRVKRPWQLGEYAVGADTPVLMSILLVHHREDLYPDPYSFRPERWEHKKPGTYEWLPFGGGIRRCLGAALAMAEQRVVLETMARRLDLEADDPAPEHALHRNVTMIPARGARVVVRSKAA